jgi:protease-4
VQGESRQPPPIPLPIPIPIFDEEASGDVTIVQQVRKLMQDENAAAVVLYIDSGGGSAAASEAMTSALDELAKSRPLVVYMNNIAGSGGYYVATPAHWIVAQPGTLTGSIGVVTAKLVNSPLFDKLYATRRVFERGENVSIMSGLAPFNDAERQIVRQTITRIYEQFVERVAHSRKLTIEQVDAIGGGRVWTGLQAKENGLVDQLGGLDAALTKARELANLSADAPLVVYTDKPKTPLPPQLAKAANPAAGLAYLNERIRQTFNGSAQTLMPYHLDL